MAKSLGELLQKMLGGTMFGEAADRAAALSALTGAETGPTVHPYDYLKPHTRRGIDNVFGYLASQVMVNWCDQQPFTCDCGDDKCLSHSMAAILFNQKFPSPEQFLAMEECARPVGDLGFFNLEGKTEEGEDVNGNHWEKHLFGTSGSTLSEVTNSGESDNTKGKKSWLTGKVTLAEGGWLVVETIDKKWQGHRGAVHQKITDVYFNDPGFLKVLGELREAQGKDERGEEFIPTAEEKAEKERAIAETKNRLPSGEELMQIMSDNSVKEKPE